MERRLSDRLKIVEQGDNAYLVYTKNDNSTISLSFANDVLEVENGSAFKILTFSNPLNIDAGSRKDFICSAVSADTVINLNNTSDGDAGLIELIITGAGGYTITFGSMFTKNVGGGAIDATSGKDNFIGYRKIGTDIVYSISQVQ
jgi:hypothetical protein